MSELLDLKCPNCGAPLPGDNCVCAYCGSKIVRERTEAEQRRHLSANIATPKGNYNYDFAFGSGAAKANAQSAAAAAPPVPPKTTAVTQRKTIAAILAILLGGLGVQYFYLGKYGSGILSLFFCWTWIPAIIGFFQGVIWLCTSDTDWQKRYG